MMSPRTKFYERQAALFADFRGIALPFRLALHSNNFELHLSTGTQVLKLTNLKFIELYSLRSVGEPKCSHLTFSAYHFCN